MRKHDEGYALPLVLVVMVVICLISSTILSFSLKNLQSQSASVERMTDKYQAQGEIEKVIAELNQIGEHTISAENYKEADQVLVLSATSDSVAVKCELKLTDIEVTPNGANQYKVVITEKSSVAYQLYEITSIETGGGGE